MTTESLILIIVIAGLIALFVTPVLRRLLISAPIMKMVGRALPTMGETERIALEAGTVWWDGDLFSGKNYGSIFGVLGAVSSAGAAIGPWATGVFFDIWGDYENAFVIAMVICAFSIAAMWIAGPRNVILTAGQARKL